MQINKQSTPPHPHPNIIQTTPTKIKKEKKMYVCIYVYANNIPNATLNPRQKKEKNAECSTKKKQLMSMMIISQ